MFIDFLLDFFQTCPDREAIVWEGKTFSYDWLLRRIADFEKEVDAKNLRAGAVVGIEGDFSPNSIALFLALIRKRCILVPLSGANKEHREKILGIAQVASVFRVDEKDVVTFETHQRNDYVGFYETIRERQHPGLVLFSSGTSGDPKAAVHDFTGLLEKFKTRRTSLRTLNFLLFDHWGGLNTMFHTLSNGGTVITARDRSPDAVCALVQKHKIEVLPASPTFLNLLLIGGAHERHDLSSLKVVTYGTEPMPESTLKKINAVFPSVKLQQTYGLIEVGVLRTKSESNNSLWMKIGGEDYQTRVVDGILHIKAKSTILGYINAPSPFSEDGWYITGDSVEVKGEYLRILGRKSELINVGGEKVYPAEVESVIQELDNVAEVTVYGEKNLITGKIVCARVTLARDEDHKLFTQRLRKHCGERLQKFKVPVKVSINADKQHGERYKKSRKEIENAAFPDGRAKL